MTECCLLNLLKCLIAEVKSSIVNNVYINVPSNIVNSVWRVAGEGLYDESIAPERWTDGQKTDPFSLKARDHRSMGLCFDGNPVDCYLLFCFPLLASLPLGEKRRNHQFLINVAQVNTIQKP